MRIMFVINSLNVGGAERMLVRLAAARVFQKDQLRIVTLLAGGTLEAEMQASNIQVSSLNIRKSFCGVWNAKKIRGEIDAFRPDIIHSWLYQSDIVASLFRGDIPIIWGIRQSNLDWKHNSFNTLLCATVCAFFSHFIPTSIIANSDVGFASHAKIGYAKSKVRVIGNGIDLNRFGIDKRLGNQFRKKIGLSADDLVVGIVARYDSQKNYQGFFDAASIISRRFPNCKFLLAGPGITETNSELISTAVRCELLNVCYFLGQQSNLKRVFNAIDVLISPSLGEGWPNVIAEAMACGVPCVATDVGATSAIIGDVGHVVPSDDATTLAKKVIDVLSLSDQRRRQMSLNANSRAVSKFCIETVALKYRAVYLKALGKETTDRGIICAE